MTHDFPSTSGLTLADKVKHGSKIQASNVAFVVENPAGSRIWEIAKNAALWSRGADGKALCGLFSCSYCLFGSRLRKNTRFMANFDLTQLQTCGHAGVTCGRPHASFSKIVRSARERNEIPQPLLQEILLTWIGDHSADQCIVIDMFSGFGSVARACRRLGVHAFTNDIRSGHDARVDLRKPGGFEKVLKMALGSLQREPKHVLLWLSHPCETFSSAGANYHRGRAGPTRKAVQHEKMARCLFDFLRIQSVSAS